MELNRELYIKGLEDYLENGKNLLKLTDGTYENNGITVVVSNGIITINGTATNTSFISIPYAFANLTLYSGKTYTLSCNNTTIASGGLSVRPIGNLGTFQTDLGRANSTSTTTISSNQTSTYLLIRSNSGVVANNVVVKPQLEEGPIATNFELYNGGYASKDYLENGKNLWNYNATNTIVGVTSTYSNSTLTLNGTSTGETSNISHTNMVYLNAGTYTFKIAKESGSATGNQAIFFKNYTTNTNILNTTLNLNNGNTVTFTLQNSAWVSLAIYFFASNVFTNLKLDIQLEKGSSATPYEEYYGKYLNNADIVNGILSNNQMWRFKSFSLSGATSYNLTFDDTEDLGQFAIVIINTITSANSSTKIGFCRNFSTYSYSNIFEDHTGTDVITNVSRTAGNVLKITTSTTSSIVVGVTYMRIFRRGLNYS